MLRLVMLPLGRGAQLPASFPLHFEGGARSRNVVPVPTARKVAVVTQLVALVQPMDLVRAPPFLGPERNQSRIARIARP